MGKKKTQVTNTGLDPASQKYVDAMRQQAMSASQVALAGPGGGQLPGQRPTGFFGGMIDRMRAAQQPGGNSWFMGPQTQSIGDQAAAFFNPYQQNVIDATRGEFDHMRNQALVGADQQATQANAFGGSRHGVMAGARLGEIDRAQGTQIAGLLHSGYQNALGQGTAYAEHQRQLAEQQRMEPLFRQQQAQQFMNLGMGPTGSTSTSTEKGNWASTAGGILQGAAGLYMAGQGAGLFGGGGGGSGFQSAPNFGMGSPGPWQAPTWNPQYRGPYG